MDRSEALSIISTCEGLTLSPSLSYLYMWNQVIQKTPPKTNHHTEFETLLTLRTEIVDEVVTMLSSSQDVSQVDLYINYIVKAKQEERAT